MGPPGRRNQWNPDVGYYGELVLFGYTQECQVSASLEDVQITI